MLNESDGDTENDSTMSTTSSKTDSKFRPQNELVYNKFLPYADELEAESQMCLAEIKENLGRAVMLRELKPGCVCWVTRLNLYTQLYGMKFSKEDHIAFVKLMYELVTILKLEANLFNKFGNVLVTLLKKKKLIRPDELELPWKPLYKITVQYFKPDPIGIYRQPKFLKNTLYYVVQAVKIYFPLSATQEILDELRPKLCPLNGATMCTTIQILEWFLPLQLPPEHHSMGYQLWFDEFMTMWKVCRNGPQWENDMMTLMAMLAVYNIGYIDWEPHFPLMYTTFLRCLNLPVTYKKIPNNLNHKIEMVSIAKWIIATLGNGSSAQMYLEKFLKTIETYFYPANFGRWTGKLKEFLSILPQLFVSRLHLERYAKPTWETPTPENYKLIDSDVDAFVKSMLPITKTAMFNKFCTNDAYQALQYLAAMRPNLVIPDILERMQSTFDSLTEPHKLTASIICMVAIAKPMVQGSRNINEGYVYSEGPMHVLPLLFSLLPGIDANDIGKSFATFRLISVYAMLIPIVDSSKSTAIMTEEERIICEATSRFEDFILQFFDRIFTFIDSSSSENVRLENNDGNSKSKLESMVEVVLSSLCVALLRQLSDAIFKSALHKLHKFVTERILETKIAGRLVAVVCKSFSRVNGHDTLRTLLPVFADIILPLINEDDILKEENLDHRLSYALLILSSIVDTPGNNLIPHMDTLFEILDRVLLLKSIDGNGLACSLLNCILSSLSNVTPWQCRSKQRDFNDPNYPYVRDWGERIDVDDVNIKWYVPGEEEIAIAQRIFSRYLPTPIDTLNAYCKDTSMLSREELFACLNIVRSIIRGTESILPVWTETPLELIKSSVKRSVIIPTCGVKGHITMPDGSNVRHYLAGIMSQVQRAMLEKAEDNTKSFFELIRIWSSLLLGKVRLYECTYEKRCKNFLIVKDTFENKLVKKKSYIGAVITERCDMQHELRLIAQTFTITETHKRIILELFTLAVSRYADVRSKAQASLLSTFKHVPFSYSFIIPHLLDILARDTEKHHDAYKGALYMILGSQNITLITVDDFNTVASLLSAIVLSKPSEKLSVIRLKQNITDFMSKCFYLNLLEAEISETCLEAACALWKLAPQPTLPQPNENEIQEGAENLKQLRQSNLATYTHLLDELLRCILEESLHWRHRLMAMVFIRNLVHPNHAYSVKLVRYFLQALIHDSLSERKIAIRIVTFILKQQKRKHPKITIDVRSLLGENTSNEEKKSRNVTPGMRADNSWLQYNYETRPLTAEQWDEPRYIHQFHVGYYVWPKTLEVYAPSSQQPCLDPEVRKFTDCEKEICYFFDDPQNIEKLIKYFSLEEKKGKDKFNAFKYFLFEGLFRNHGIVFLKHFLPHLQRLVVDKHESSQRCAAEIVTGIIRGAKHWPFQMTCDLWQVLLPIIRTAIANLTEETITDWGMCFGLTQEQRDPNRHHWLLECLMEEPPLKDSFVECGRLYVLQAALHQQSWRVTELLQRLLVRLEDRLLANPFQNVRRQLASVLVTVFSADLSFPRDTTDSATPRMRALIDKIIPKLERLIKDNDAIKLQSVTQNFDNMNNIIEKLANVPFNESEEALISEKEQEMSKRLLKTVCTWIIISLQPSEHATILEFYKIFVIICQLESSEADEELNKLCLRTLAMLAQAFMLPENISVALNAVKTVSEHSSWSTRFASLEFLQVLVFHNMGIILSNALWINCVKDIVLHLLEDVCLEVREKASQVLGGLLHCTLITDQENLLEEFKRKAKIKLQKKNNSTDKNVSDNIQINAMCIRHAGVLGLCAFIRAHPYDVPEYIPSVFEHLEHHMRDPEPIPMTIRKTLSDFKRTHYDGWTGIKGHAQSFTEEQLAVLEDLTVPPSHYA